MATSNDHGRTAVEGRDRENSEISISSSMPAHLRRRMENRRLQSASRRRTKEELDQAQVEAEKRKQNVQTERLEAIKKCDERIRNVDDKIQLLLQYDSNKRAPGDSKGRRMTSRELKETARLVDREFRQLSSKNYHPAKKHPEPAIL